MAAGLGRCRGRGAAKFDCAETHRLADTGNSLGDFDLVDQRMQASGMPRSGGRHLWASLLIAMAIAMNLMVSSAAASGMVVTIVDYQYAPSPMTITAGQSITWVNKG